MIDFTITKNTKIVAKRQNELKQKIKFLWKRSKRRSKIFSAPRALTHTFKLHTGIEKQCVQRNEYYSKVQHSITFCFFFSRFFLSLFLFFSSSVNTRCFLSFYIFLSFARSCVRFFFRRRMCLTMVYCLFSWNICSIQQKFSPR